MLNFGALEYLVAVFLKDHLDTAEYERVNGRHFNDRVARIANYRITHSPQKDMAFSSKTDEVSKSKTKKMLAIPLICDGACIGVAEFLNKRNNGRFSNEDQVLTERLSVRLGRRVGEFISDPNNFVQLGITPERTGEYATILFCDISNSSELSQRMNEATVIDLANEYFETLCDLALSMGGAIDKFMGDGFMLTAAQPNCPDRSFRILIWKVRIPESAPAHIQVIGGMGGITRRLEIAKGQRRAKVLMWDVVRRAQD